jgi:glycosyltransferase involved in cell wall biosynthesis
MSMVKTEAAPRALWAQPRTATERIRLLKFNTIFAVGGTEGQVTMVAKGLHQGSFDVHLACLLRSGQLLSQVELLENGLVDYKIRNLYGRHAMTERLRFAGYLRQNLIQIVHTYNFYPNVFAIPAARLAGTPVVLASIRDTGAYLTPARQQVHKAVCRLAHAILVNAEAIKQWLIAQGYDARKITVIRNGVDLARFGGRGHAPRIRHELGLPPDAPLVAVVARLSPIKGLEYFLDAAVQVAASHPDARFLVVGEGLFNDTTYRQDLERYAARLGLSERVVFTGLRTDIPDLLSELAVSVLPSLSEGLSNTLLESMAAAVPVVATTVGGTSEAVEDGVTGFLVPPRDAGALARAMERILDNPELATRLGRAGRRRVAERFSIDGMIRETERLYVRLLETRRHALAS